MYYLSAFYCKYVFCLCSVFPSTDPGKICNNIVTLCKTFSLLLDIKNREFDKQFDINTLKIINCIQQFVFAVHFRQKKERINTTHYVTALPDSRVISLLWKV